MGQDQRLRGFVVLVVEDDVRMLETVTVLIADALGCRALTASSGVEALQIIDSGAHVDLLFADIVMPKMDGLALTRVVHDRLPNLPIVLATGLQSAVDSANENGAIPLIKPYSLQQLEAVFAEQLHTVHGATPSAGRAPATTIRP